MSTLNKIKARLTEIKDQIEVAEEKASDAKNQLKDSEERFQKAEEEATSYKRRIALLKTELSKVLKQVDEKQRMVDLVEGNVNQSHSHTRMLEDLEIEGDETIGKLEIELVKHQRKQEEAESLAESFERKLAHATQEYQRALHRCKEGEMAVSDLEVTYESISKKLKKLEQKESEATDREDIMEEKIKYLENVIKERTDQVEETERKNVTLERLREERDEERDKYQQDMNKILEEQRKIEQIADEL